MALQLKARFMVSEKSTQELVAEKARDMTCALSNYLSNYWAAPEVPPTKTEDNSHKTLCK
jgi:hypothetical protein